MIKKIVNWFTRKDLIDRITKLEKDRDTYISKYDKCTQELIDCRNLLFDFKMQIYEKEKIIESQREEIKKLKEFITKLAIEKNKIEAYKSSSSIIEKIEKEVLK